MITSATQGAQLLVRPAALICGADCLPADELSRKDFKKPKVGMEQNGKPVLADPDIRLLERHEQQCQNGSTRISSNCRALFTTEEVSGLKDLSI